MENALAAIVIIFIILFAVLTLSNTLLDTQDMMRVDWQETQDRQQDQNRTAITAETTKTHAGTQVEVTLKNTGSVKLADFNKWDVIVQYYDGAFPSAYHIARLPYATTLTANDQWTVQGIYADAAHSVAEVYEPKIFNPGEEAILSLQLSPAIAAGSYVELVISPSNGSSTSTMFKRNVPPVLATNNTIQVNNGESVTIDKVSLETTDVDNEPAELVYTVTVPPTQGTLAPATFTQADIDNGLLNYANTGTQADSFQFTVTDGQDSIGTFTSSIAVNLPPTLDVNTGTSVPVNTAGLIGDLMLKTNDLDNTASQLVYTVTTPPTQGDLSMSTFTQDDVDKAHLSYNQTSGNPGVDSFAFTVTDGKKVIGPFTFTITAF